MDIEPKTKQALENMLFYGVVCEQNPAAGTARVTREDKEGKVTAELMVLQRGTKSTKDFYMPAIGDQVLCVQTPNFSGKGTGDGFILGAFYSNIDPPPKDAANKTRVLDHTGDVIWRIGGKLSIHAGTLDIVGGGDVVASGISLNSHVHGGVVPGGGTTAGPQ